MAGSDERVKIEKLATQHLPNAVRVHARIVSGGLPTGDAAFAELQSLGIKTIISVDGAKPDVATAAKHGLRYVHLPHGYDGIPTARAEQLAKAVRELPGPIYIHCHHGRHRSPAAAAVACVASGLLEPADGALVLSVAGTSDKYIGLFAAVRDAQRIDDADLAKLVADFPEIARLPAMAEAMVAIEHAFDPLVARKKAGWSRSADSRPGHEALLLREHYTELLRTEDVRRRPAEFRRLLAEGETAAQRLEDLLQSTDRAESARPKSELDQAFEAVAENCTRCHRAYRDVPQRP